MDARTEELLRVVEEVVACASGDAATCDVPTDLINRLEAAATCLRSAGSFRWSSREKRSTRNR